MNAFFSTGELQIAIEANTSYFQYSDELKECSCSSLVTQVKLTDYGLSYIIRLSDGRFLVIDGGNAVEEEADALYSCLVEQSASDIPDIAGWVMTHPHSDHLYCFFPFWERYGSCVKIEKFFFNFPAADDISHYPKLGDAVKRFPGCIGSDVIKIFLQIVKNAGIPVYTPHTGQKYALGNTELKFFATIDDTIHCSCNINATSLMFSTEIEGQNIFWGGDGSFSDARLSERYGNELKADILQIPHHGFGCGTDQGQINGYRYIAPRVCLLPASHMEAFTSFTTYREGTNYLMTRQGVEEIITGKKQRTIQLPYEPHPSCAIELRQQYLEGRDNCGSRTWIFSDLNTCCAEDYEFSVLNTSYLNSDISIEIFFENMQKKIVRVRTTGPRLGLFRINCAVSAEESETFDVAEFLAEHGIPEGTHFAVRFICSIPVVISHTAHNPAYRSTIV